MRIWLVSAYDRPKGHSSRTYDFAQFLTKKGHQVTFFTNSFCHYNRVQKNFKGYFCFETLNNIDVVWLSTPGYSGNGVRRGLNMVSNFLQILRFGFSASYQLPDVIIGPSVPLPTSLAALLIARRLNAPFVFEIRDVWPEALVLMGAMQKPGVTYLVFRAIEKFLYKKAAGIISTLPYVAEHISESVGEEKAYTLIPNPVDLLLFDEPCDIRPLSNKTIRIVYIGGFGVDHDVETIIRVAQELDRERPSKFEFELYGAGVNRSNCEQIVAERRISNVRFHDPIEKSEIPKVQCNADILIAAVTPTDSYKFGLNLNKLGGYLASGRPVIFIGDSPNDPVSDSGAWYTVPAQSVSEAILAIDKILCMPLDEMMARSAMARQFVERELSINVLGERFERSLDVFIEMYNRSDCR